MAQSRRWFKPRLQPLYSEVRTDESDTKRTTRRLNETIVKRGWHRGKVRLCLRPFNYQAPICVLRFYITPTPIMSSPQISLLCGMGQRTSVACSNSVRLAHHNPCRFGTRSPVSCVYLNDHLFPSHLIALEHSRRHARRSVLCSSPAVGRCPTRPAHNNVKFDTPSASLHHVL